MQIAIVCVGANGPFVDEGLYTVAGLRVLEGRGLSDGYARWFNGSPFVWPVLAAMGHHLGGLAGARLMAALLSTVTLVAFARTAGSLFGRAASEWSALAFGLNGLFLALAHFAVYDVAALAGLAVSMCCVSRASTASLRWPILAAIAFAGAVISKYGYIVMVVPLLGLLVSVRGVELAARPLAAFVAVAGAILAAYFWMLFGTLFPTSAGTYFGQTFGRSRGHIAALQLVFGLVPCVLAVAGALVAWRRCQRVLVVTCLLALALYPTFHLWFANFVSAQKHVVAGFLFGYLLAGVALERLWASRRRAAVVVVMAGLTAWGGLQCYWQDLSWGDIRPLAHHLGDTMKPGDGVVAESSWAYALYLYPMGKIHSPWDVIDANHAPASENHDVCLMRWLVGNLDSASLIRDSVERCGHQLVRSVITRQYYVDTARLRVGVQPIVISLYRLP